MSSSHKSVAPSPEVQYLPAVFRRIQAGDILMPAFQRGFVWERKQIIELLQSIYQGFPIGSVLLWKTQRRELKLQDPSESNFPNVRDKFPVSYVLDGLQRLSTLYAVFHFDPEIHASMFDVSFDLRAKEFVSQEAAEAALPLNVLFKPTEFIKYHSSLSALPKGSELIQSAVELLSTFQEYLIPIVTIEGRDVGEVVQIFERINSTGVRLGAVDFMRAVTWSEQFDLNRELSRIAQAAVNEGFEIPHETLIKVLAIALGYPPRSDAMLEMRELTASQLRNGVGKATGLLKRTIEFVRTQLGIESYALIPYEGQFLALVGFHKQIGKPGDVASAQVVRWFWTVSLNEDMQGRSEHQVARIVSSMEDVRAGRTKLKGKLTLTTAALKERRFRWGYALPSAFTAMLAKNAARSLVTGEKISTREYLTSDGGNRFLSFVEEAQITNAIGKEVPGGKVIANTIVASIDDVSTLRQMSAAQVIRNLQRTREDAANVLASQFISEGGAQAILKGRVGDFLEARAQSIVTFAGPLCFGPNRA